MASSLYVLGELSRIALTPRLIRGDIALVPIRKLRDQASHPLNRPTLGQLELSMLAWMIRLTTAS